MAPDGKGHDAVKSPLHRLQSAIVKDLPFRYARESEHQIYTQAKAQARRSAEHTHTFDTESLYSFDSVSTNGRLLDRLDLDSEEYYEGDDYFRRRESFTSIQSTGRLLDRLGLDDNYDELVLATLPAYRYKPILANSSSNSERMKSSSNIPLPIRTLPQNGRVRIRSAPHKVVLQKVTYSVDSLQADIATFSQSSTISLASLEESGSGSSGANPRTPTKFISHRSRSFPSGSFIPETYADASYEQDNSNLSLPTLDGHMPHFKQTASPSQRNVSASPRQRNVSSSSNTSSTSIDTGMPVFNPSSKFDPSLEAATKKAIQLRMEGKHREASYQLQISASPPRNYPKAMYLYAKALQVGQGVKLNEAQALRWLCRCVLVSYIIEAATVDSRSLTNYVSKLVELLPSEMVGLVRQNVAMEKIDPFRIYDEFLNYLPSKISKISANNLKDGNTVGGAYFQLGKCLIHGSGVPKDEVTARLFLAKSASLCYGDAMVTLGELWSSKSKHFKKDLSIAAVWLRTGELFGKKNLGNSWIYKEKYINRGKLKK